MKHEQAKRILTIQGESNPVSYWEHGEEVYRLNEYEPVQFDIYGLPLGARWECNLFLCPSIVGFITMYQNVDAA